MEGEKTSERIVRKVRLYLLGAAGVVFVLGIASCYIHYVQNSLMSQTVSHVQIVTQQQQQAFDSFIARDLERIRSYSKDFSKLDSKETDKIGDKLDIFYDVDAFYSVINLDTGECYNSKSREVYQISEEARKEFLGCSDAGVRESRDSLYTDKNTFGYYGCFTFQDGVKGLVQKEYETDRISKEFTLTFYNDRGFAYVINQHGDVLMRPFNMEDDFVGENIFDMFDDSENSAEQKSSLLKALDEQETGTLVFQSKENEYVYTYTPLESVDGGYLISIVPRAAIADEANQVIGNSQIVIVIAIVIMLVLFAFVFLAWRTHKKLLRQQLEKEYREEQFGILANYLANNTDDAYIMLEEDKRTIEYVSPNVRRVLGILDSDPIELRVLDYMRESLDGMRENESLEPMEMERSDRVTGERKWIRETIYCAYIQGEKKFIIYLSDRTKDKKTQDNLKIALDSAKDANQAKSAFLSSMSHDIRTPMNAIIGLATLLEQEADNPECVIEYARKIDASSQYLLGLINDILDMNKIESGKVRLNDGELDLPEVIERLNSIIRPQVKAKEQTLNIYTSCFSHEYLIGDKIRINQIFINILSNAVKYTPKGGRIDMTVSELPQMQEDFCRIQFKVKDNGQGMSEEYQKIIFEPFTREQSSTVNEIQGTGLGMAITKNLVELMGGTMSVESKLGEGTTFTVELSLRIQEKEDDAEFWKEHGIRRIIVADDDKEICENVVRTLSEQGITVDYVTDGELVIPTMQEARVRGEPYDLLLLDWQMPGTSGLEVAQLIQKNYPNGIPILLFTAYDWTDIEKEALKVGVDHFMPKPFFISTFKEAIKRVVYKKTSEKNKLSRADDSIMKDKHILIVEDNKINRFVLQKILTSRGATYDVAENGQEAVTAFEASEVGRYDFILMDVKMPVMDGYHATRMIRAGKHPCAKTIPVIAMTANAFVDDVVDALEAGMDAHVPKPIILEQLEKTIREVLIKKESTV